MNESRPAAAPAGPTLPVRSAALLLFAALLAALVVAGGLLLTRVLTPSPVSRFDERAIEWFVAQRTPALNDATAIGADFAMTLIVFAATIVVALLLRVWLGRWRESLVLIVCVLGEWILFRITNATVGRERPEPGLDGGGRTASFPSGHAGIAVAFYGGLALIVLRSLPQRRLAIAIASFCLAVVVMVALTRVYRGMHFPTDVLGSWLLGGIWVVTVVNVLLPRRRTSDAGA